MIDGSVNARLEAIIDLRIGWRGAEITLSTIVDTGFSEFLTLPMSVISALLLPYEYSVTVQLADGHLEGVDVYEGACFWDGQWRQIYVQATDGDILGGMRLLEGHVLGIRVEVGGEVTIESIA